MRSIKDKKLTLEELQEGKVFLIDKPLEWTSFDVVKRIKNNIKKQFHLKKFKVGHAGTLDPKATGLLVICVGKATKSIAEIQDAYKVYSGTIKLGVQTPSYDTETEEINSQSLIEITEEKIYALEDYFKGEFLQTPPIFSALKKDGKRAYELARAGEEIKLEARKIHFYDFKITQIDMPFVSFKVKCSKGTYIRSLAHDAGEKLQCGGYLVSLKREEIGDYKLEDADNSILEYGLFESKL